jgi:hypothetical protein
MDCHEIFFKEFWDIMSHDLKEMQRLNHGMITLISKVHDADIIQKFRPIYLLNVSYKLLKNLLAKRLRELIHKIVADSHRALIEDKYVRETDCYPS